MKGVGSAGGAGTIVNAIATGRGAAFGIDLRAQATVEDARRWTVLDDGQELDAGSSRLAIESARQVGISLKSKQPLRIDIQSEIPPERGLKSSSAVAVAVIQASLAAHGKTWPAPRILKAAARAGLRSGTSITGAFDDAAACLLGGAVVTDNRRMRLVREGELPKDLEALVHVPKERLKTAAVKKTDFSSVRPLVNEAWDLARNGEFDKAMIVNSAAYAGVLGHDIRFSIQALRDGAWAAGLSGKGPAQIALGPGSTLAPLQNAYPDSRRVALRRRAA
jgi:shikimate kinase